MLLKNAAFISLFLFVGTHFRTFVRKFLVHLRTVYASPQTPSGPLDQAKPGRRSFIRSAKWHFLQRANWINHTSVLNLKIMSAWMSNLSAGLRRFFAFLIGAALFNPITPKSDQFQISPAASWEIYEMERDTVRDSGVFEITEFEIAHSKWLEKKQREIPFCSR